MAKRKPWWLRLINTIFGIVISLCVFVAGVAIFINVKYDINIFKTISQVNSLNKEVNESEAFTKKLTDEDNQSASTAVNLVITDLIQYDETDGYTVSNSITNQMTANLRLTDKQVGAILNMLIKSEGDIGNIALGDAELSFELLQLSFSNYTESSTDCNVVLKVDITSFKETLNSFPLNLLNNFIPDTIYISSNVGVTKGENAFEYSITSKGLTLNNLSVEETRDLANVLNKFMNFGDIDTLNEQIGKSFVDAMIGTSENSGFAYGLKSLGAEDFDFVQENDVIYLEIQM